jgi:hypothetical protein
MRAACPSICEVGRFEFDVAIWPFLSKSISRVIVTRVGRGETLTPVASSSQTKGSGPDPGFPGGHLGDVDAQQET